MSRVGTSCEIPGASWLMVSEIAGTKYIDATVVSLSMAIFHLLMAGLKRSSSMCERKICVVSLSENERLRRSWFATYVFIYWAYRKRFFKSPILRNIKCCNIFDGEQWVRLLKHEL